MKEFSKIPKKKAGRASIVMLRALEVIDGCAGGFVDFAETMMTMPYGTSARGMERLIAKNRADRERNTMKEVNEARYRQLLYRMRRDGLIHETKTEGNILKYLLTAKGRKARKLLKTKMASSFFAREYPHEASEEFIIVSFDIAEKQRNRRDWLRATLKHLGYTQVQKSVWIGKIKIPKELFEDLHHYGLTDQVEIFEARKLGSMSPDSSV